MNNCPKLGRKNIVRKLFDRKWTFIKSVPGDGWGGCIGDLPVTGGGGQITVEPVAALAVWKKVLTFLNTKVEHIITAKIFFRRIRFSLKILLKLF
jgi:hypothetical protein